VRLAQRWHRFAKAHSAFLARLSRFALWTVALLALLSSGLSIGGCAETELVAHGAKSVQHAGGGGSYGGQSGGTSAPSYKVGKPYQVAGQWYQPVEDESYDRTGTASWYGPKFHGKRTANGEIFNENALTAAHRTLPMPVLVRVTNLENGRSVVLRVNDRGPFAHNREIDVSRRAAQLLGFEGKGTANVRVQYVSRAPLDGSTPDDIGDIRTASVTTPAPVEAPYAAPSFEPAQASAPVQTAELTTPPAISAAPVATPPGNSGSNSGGGFFSSAQAATPPVGSFYVQAGAFADLANAERLSKAIADLGRVELATINVNGAPLYRVRVGPLSDALSADNTVSELKRRGLSGAHLVR
jgi:rare lipoprotein A